MTKVHKSLLGNYLVIPRSKQDIILSMQLSTIHLWMVSSTNPNLNVISNRGAVAQLVEHPSKVPVLCNSTVMGLNRERDKLSHLFDRVMAKGGRKKSLQRHLLQI